MEIVIWKRISDDKPLGIVNVPECASDAEYDHLKSEVLALVEAMKADKAQEIAPLTRENEQLRGWLRSELTISDADIDAELARA